MKLARLLTLASGAAAGYAAARSLLDRASPPLPGPAREGVEAVQARLRSARELAYHALTEAARTAEESRRDLTAEYLRRAGRSGERPPRGR